jgi:hypothetical protein
MDRADLELVTCRARPRQPGRRRRGARRRALGGHQAAGRAGGPAGPAPVRAHHAPAQPHGRRRGRVPACGQTARRLRCARSRTQRTPERAARPACARRHASASAGAGSGRRWPNSSSAIRPCRSTCSSASNCPTWAPTATTARCGCGRCRGRTARDWISRRLARNQRVLVASPAYLSARGTPRAVEELATHDCLVVRENTEAQRRGSGALGAQARQGERAVARARAGAAVAATRARWCATGASRAAASCCAACGTSRRRWPAANWCACCRNTRCPTPTSTGSRPGVPRRRAACGCWSTSWLEQFRSEPWKP